MTTQHDCYTLRAQLFDYRLDELSALDRASFETRAALCPSCQLHIHRVIDMMDLASSEDVWIEEELAADPELPDRMFEHISATLGLDVAHKRPPATVLKGVFGAPVQQDIEEDIIPPRRHTLWLSVAALLVLGAGGVLGYRMLNASPEAMPVVPDESIALKDVQAPVLETTQLEKAPLLAKLEAEPKTPRALKVFASKEAKWRVSSTKTNQHVLNLERGTVLVEFLPTSSESLKVITRDTTVEVTGTVFYVSQPESTTRGEVGVLTGEVKVRASGQKKKPAQTLATGQRVKLDDLSQIEMVRTEDRQQHFVDLARHETLLASNKRSKAPIKVARPAAKRSAPAAPANISVNELSDQARQALMQKHYERAATLHERLLKRLGPKSKTRSTVRLELANLYLTHLNQRTRAVNHLKRFVYDHPYDVATPSARTRLCRLMGPDAEQEPACKTP